MVHGTYSSSLSGVRLWRGSIFMIDICCRARCTSGLHYAGYEVFVAQGTPSSPPPINAVIRVLVLANVKETKVA